MAIALAEKLFQTYKSHWPFICFWISLYCSRMSGSWTSFGLIHFVRCPICDTLIFCLLILSLWFKTFRWDNPAKIKYEIKHFSHHCLLFQIVGWVQWPEFIFSTFRTSNGFNWSFSLLFSPPVFQRETFLSLRAAGNDNRSWETNVSWCDFMFVQVQF